MKGTMAKKKKSTVALGAVIARSLLQGYISRQIKKISRMHPTTALQRGYISGLLDVRVWLKDQKNRTDKPGGIGR